MFVQYQVREDPWKETLKFTIKISFICITSGFGSHNNEQMESNTFEIVNAGDHWDRRISRQIAPFELMFGWNIFVVNLKLSGREILLKFVMILIERTWFWVAWMDNQQENESTGRKPRLEMDYPQVPWWWPAVKEKIDRRLVNVDLYFIYQFKR